MCKLTRDDGVWPAHGGALEGAGTNTLERFASLARHVTLLPRTAARLHVVLMLLRRRGHVEHLVRAAKGLCAPLAACPADPQHREGLMQYIQRRDAKPGHLEHQHLATTFTCQAALSTAVLGRAVRGPDRAVSVRGTGRVQFRACNCPAI
jgi:hypothetical protein